MSICRQVIRSWFSLWPLDKVSSMFYDRCLSVSYVSLYRSLWPCLFVSLSLCLYLCLSVSQYLCISVSLSLPLGFCLSVAFSVFVSLCLSFCFSVSLFPWICLRRSVFFPFSLSTLCIYLCICRFNFFFSAYIHLLVPHTRQSINPMFWAEIALLSLEFVTARHPPTHME